MAVSAELPHEAIGTLFKPWHGTKQATLEVKPFEGINKKAS